MNSAFHKYESSDSVAYLDHRGDTGSSISSPVQGKQPSTGNLQGTAPLTLAVSIRRGRLLLLSTLVLGTIIVIVIVLKQGVELTRFEASTKNPTDRQKLLDQYNSYSGNVSSAFGKPIEMFVAILAQLLLLQLMADAFAQPTISRRQWFIRLAASAGVGYLMSNGFNAANVQLRELDVHAVIVASDLSVASSLNGSVSARTTTVTSTVSEMSPRNLITNTVLRNVVLPRVTYNQTICDWVQSQYESQAGIDDPLPTADYGFTQRDWQSRLLQEALPTKTLKMVVNPTNRTANKDVKSADLPMNASLAADLFLYMMTVGPRVFSWGSVGAFTDPVAMNRRYPRDTPLEKQRNFVEKTAVVAELLPVSESATESEKREWFLQALPASVTRQFNNSKNTSRSDIIVEFSHVEISPTIDFDAVTFEFEMDPILLATATSKDKSTRYTQIAQASPPGVYSNCGPWPALCLVKKKAYQPKPGAVEDPRQQVHAFSACTTKHGDALMSYGFGSTTFSCNESSNSSIMIMSVGKRLVADSLHQNKSDNVTTQIARKALITNLRKIYTITIGRLSWRLENLATVFRADCGATATSHKCLGLQLPLSTSTLSANGLDAGRAVQQQRLVVHADALPTKLIMPSSIIYAYRPRAIPLVEVADAPFEMVMGGDILLPHNIGSINWTNETVMTDCDSVIESVLYSNLNNHIYIEHGFQTAYTAATFFLLQNAVVKDTIVSSANVSSMTLSFDGNTQDVLVIVSTPFQNAVLTFLGCGILMFCVIATVGRTSWASSTPDPLAGITAPQAIARVMMDDQQFPASLLHRRVVYYQGEQTEFRKLEQFTIAQLAVVHEEDGQHLATE
jgi:hypothetical protein